MSERKRKGMIRRVVQGNRYKIVEFCAGIILLMVGILKSLDISLGEEVKKYDGMEPCIFIGAEEYKAKIDVSCYVGDGGEIILGLDARERLDEAVRVWIFVRNYGEPFSWETTEGVDHVNLSNSFFDEEFMEEGDLGEENMFLTALKAARTYTSQKTGNLQGVSRELLTRINGEIFTTTVESNKEKKFIHFKMNAEEVEYHHHGDIIINMPWIASLRVAPAYDINAEDLTNLAESNNVYSLFYNCMIDGKPVWEPLIYVHGFYQGNYCTKSDYVVSKVIPTPEWIEPDIMWEEKDQWASSLTFYDLNYDKTVARNSWLGGILIAVGSGLVVLPLSEWLKA